MQRVLDEEGEVLVIYGDKETKSQNVNLRIWDDTGTLSWVRLSKSMMGIEVGDLTVTMGDVEALLADRYWLDERIEYDGDGNPIYIGKNITLGVSEDSTTWYITRYDWTSGNCTRIRRRVTSWTLRASGW